MTSPPPLAPRPPERGKALAAINLGMNFAVGMAVLSYLGYRLDQHRGGGSAWTLAGMALGLAYGAYETWKAVRSLNNQDNTRPPGGT